MTKLIHILSAFSVLTSFTTAVDPALPIEITDKPFPWQDWSNTVDSQPQATNATKPFNTTFSPTVHFNGSNATSPHPPQQSDVYRGFSIGAWQGGQTQPVKQQQNWTDAFNRIRKIPGNFNSARTYAVEGALPNILAAANETDIHVLIGLYLGSHDNGARFNSEFNVLKETVAQHGLDHIIGITVGNEDLYRGDSPPSLIADEIKQVQQWLDQQYPDACVGVGHVDTWTHIVNATNEPVTSAADFLVANIFPYWEKSPIHQAEAYFDAAISNITAFEESEDIEVWIGETGWPVSVPSGLSSQFPGVPGEASLQQYWSSIVCSSAFQQRNAFYYIDYDDGEPVDLPQWGVFRQNGEARIAMQCGPV